MAGASPFILRHKRPPGGWRPLDRHLTMCFAPSLWRTDDFSSFPAVSSYREVDAIGWAFVGRCKVIHNLAMAFWASHTGRCTKILLPYLSWQFRGAARHQSTFDRQSHIWNGVPLL